MSMTDDMEGTGYGRPAAFAGLRLPGYSSNAGDSVEDEDGSAMMMATGGRSSTLGYENSTSTQGPRGNQSLQEQPHSRGKLSIDLLTSNNLSLDSSYDISLSGTLRYKGLEINSAGIKNLRQRSSGSGGGNQGPMISDEKTPSPLLQSQSPQAVFNSPSFSSSSSNLLSPFSASSSLSSTGSSSSALASGDEDDVLKISPKDLIELGVIGKGSCGIVKRAFHVPTCLLVALKSVNVHDDEKRRQMVKELRVLMSFDSPYIIKLLGAFYEQGLCTLMLEYMNRLSLSDALKASRPITDELLLAKIAKDTLEGLAYLHELHHVHRDIKPGNLLVNHEGEVKLADFGVLTELNSTGAMASTYVGTTMFMSPERVGNLKYSCPSDIWSVGVSLIYLAIGQAPYSVDKGLWGLMQAIREAPSPNLPDGSPFSREIRHFISCCLIKDPEKRWTARSLLLHPWLKHCEERLRSGHAKFASPTPFDQHLPSDSEDLDKICDALIERKFLEKKLGYTRNLYNLAMFDRIARQIGVPFTIVQQKFEQKYMVKTQQKQIEVTNLSHLQAAIQASTYNGRR